MPCVAPRKSKFLCCNNTLRITACSPLQIVPASPGLTDGGSVVSHLGDLFNIDNSCGNNCGRYETVILDASKGSLCDIIFEGPVKNVIVTGGNKHQNAYVSVIFRGSSLNNAFQDGRLPSQNNPIGNAVLNQRPYVIENLIVDGSIHKFEIVGIDTFNAGCRNLIREGIAGGEQHRVPIQYQPIVSFGTIRNNAKYFTVNTKFDDTCYGNPTARVLEVGSFFNYGHLLFKGGPCSTTDLFIKCKLTSTGRNKNFRIPYGVLYLNAGADVRLCNVSCECIKPPPQCECSDAYCYDDAATQAPLINCVAVVCNNEQLPSNIYWRKSIRDAICENYGNPVLSGFYGCESDPLCVTSPVKCNDVTGEKCEYKSCNSRKLLPACCGRNEQTTNTLYFNNLEVNPCFLNKVNFEIKCSDLVICDFVARVYSCTLQSSCCAAIGGSCRPTQGKAHCIGNDHQVGSQGFTPSCGPGTSWQSQCDDGYTSVCHDYTLSRGRCVASRNGQAYSPNGYAELSQRQQANLLTYLINLTIETPAAYIGRSFDQNTIYCGNGNANGGNCGTCFGVGGSDAYKFIGAEFSGSNFKTQRLVFVGNDPYPTCQPGAPANNYSNCISCVPQTAGGQAGVAGVGQANCCSVCQYALMTSKCKEDPVVDPWTSLPRRCCPLYCRYQFPDRIRPICGFDWAPPVLSPVCCPCELPPPSGVTACEKTISPPPCAKEIGECYCPTKVPPPPQFPDCPERCLPKHPCPDKLCIKTAKPDYHPGDGTVNKHEPHTEFECPKPKTPPVKPPKCPSKSESTKSSGHDWASHSRSRSSEQCSEEHSESGDDEEAHHNIWED